MSKSDGQLTILVFRHSHRVDDSWMHELENTFLVGNN